MNDTLFPVPDASAPTSEPDRGRPRVQRPNRAQLEWRAVDLDGLLPADHRVGHGPLLADLLTTSVVALVAEGVATLTRVAHDGLKVRASAGSGSFRGGDRLAELLTEATAHVTQLRREVDEDPSATSRRQAAARQRAGEERRPRVAEAL